MKLAIVIVVLALGILVYALMQEPDGEKVTTQGDWIIPPRGEIVAKNFTGTEGEIEEQIRAKVGRVQQELRSVAIALESFYIDYNYYPEDLMKLTTPIAYITSNPKDPFTQNSVYGYKTNKHSKWVVWSIGADGKDQLADEKYDPTNGTISAGGYHQNWPLT